MAKNEQRFKNSILAGIDLGEDETSSAAPAPVKQTAPAAPAATQKEEPIVAAPEQPQVHPTAPVSQPEPARARGEEQKKQIRSFRTCVNITQELRDRARTAQDAGLFYSLNNTFNILLDEYLSKNGF